MPTWLYPWLWPFISLSWCVLTCTYWGSKGPWGPCKASCVCAEDGWTLLKQTLLMKMKEALMCFWQKWRTCLALLTCSGWLVLFVSPPFSLKLLVISLQDVLLTTKYGKIPDFGKSDTSCWLICADPYLWPKHSPMPKERSRQRHEILMSPAVKPQDQRDLWIFWVEHDF